MKETLQKERSESKRQEGGCSTLFVHPYMRKPLQGLPSKFKTTSKESPILRDLICLPSLPCVPSIPATPAFFFFFCPANMSTSFPLRCSPVMPRLQNLSLDLQITDCSFITIQVSFQMQCPQCVNQSHLSAISP